MTTGVLAAPIRALARATSALSGARLTIMIFHRVLPTADPMSPDTPDAQQFARIICTIREHFHIMPLDQAIARLRNGTLPSGTVCITFDDGYADNATVAVPVLRQLGACATFFVASGYLDGGRMWNDTITESVRRHDGPTMDLTGLDLGSHAIASMAQRVQAATWLIDRLKYLPFEERASLVARLAAVCGEQLPDDLMMTREQVRQIRAQGMLIGAHTVSHPILSKVGMDQARHEITQSKHALEEIVDDEVELFAYPNGRPGIDYAIDHVRLVREAGFKCAVSTANGAATANADLFQLPRFTPWYPQPLGFCGQLLRNLLRTSYAMV